MNDTDRLALARFQVEEANRAIAALERNRTALDGALSQKTSLRNRLQTQLTALEANPVTNATKIAQLKTRIANIDADINQIQSEKEQLENQLRMALGEQGAGFGHMHSSSGSDNILLPLLAAGVVTLAVLAATAGGKDSEKDPPPQQEDPALAEARAQAERAAHDRAMLEGQLANLGELRDRDFANMDMQTAAYASVILSGPPPVTGSLGIGGGGDSLTYGGMTDQQASFGVPMICFNQANLQVPCFGSAASHGMVSQKPVKCFDANHRSVPCPSRPTAAN